MDFKVYGHGPSLTIMGPVVGVVCDLSTYDDGETWNVCRCFLAPKYRRKGLGRKLLETAFRAIQDRFPGAKWVDVAPGGYDMRYGDQVAFYRACGFEPDPGVEGRFIHHFLTRPK